MLGIASLAVVGLGLAYFVCIAGAGLLDLRSRPDTAPSPDAIASVPATVFVLIACLDEELVIEDTLARLTGDPRARIVVVDDASSDRTAAIAAAVDPTRVEVVSRRLPDARRARAAP